MLDYPEHVFSRNRPDSPATPAEKPAASPAAAPAGKGHATPKRKTAEAARRHPLGALDRKAAARAQRATAKETRDREYQAMQTGDERYLPVRDKGPVKRWIRDYVDARRSLGEYFLPVSLAVVFATLLTSGNATAALAVIVLLYLIVIAVIIDALLLRRSLKRKLEATFGAAKVPRGSLMYGILRSFQMRRTRLPKPQVKRGEFPS